MRKMSAKLFTLVLTLYTCIAFAQNEGGPGFDMADFHKKTETAEWLCHYDGIAWMTSDSVMTQDKKEIERLGNEWFCFQEKEKWHAVYGKYEHGIFDQVFHYVVNKEGHIHRTGERIDTSTLNRYSRALQTANNQLTKLKDSVRIRFNQYIRENEDHTFTVWIFPAFQTNMVAVYGGEFIYTIDATGNNILKDDSYYLGKLWGVKVGEPVAITLDYSNIEQPTLGAVFFVWYYKEYFTKILIDNSKSVSSVIKTDDHWVWVSSVKDH